MNNNVPAPVVGETFPRIDDDGTVWYSPDLAIPFSAYASEEGKANLVQTQRDYQELIATSGGNPFGPDQLLATRKWFDDRAKDAVEREMLPVFPVDLTREEIGGVQTDVVVPKGGVAEENQNRVLIHLHGGGFTLGARWIGLQECVPIAGVGGFKIITVDYRMGPEHRFPAASEDVAKVYNELLKQYRPENIGIFGCSAGGQLSMQAVAWFVRHSIPRPGAIGVSCAGGLIPKGDSIFTGRLLLGNRVPPLNTPYGARRVTYFGPDEDEEDELALPATSPGLLALFPPTLMISGTRDFLLSETIATHTRLVAAGVEASLHVWDGMDHGFHAHSPAPLEARQAYDVTVNFFRKHLGTKPL